jgi:hypothetical protein
VCGGVHKPIADVACGRHALHIPPNFCVGHSLKRRVLCLKTITSGLKKQQFSHNFAALPRTCKCRERKPAPGVWLRKRTADAYTFNRLPARGWMGEIDCRLG